MASGTFPTEESSVIFLSIKESDLATNHVKECLGEGKGKEEKNVSEWWCIQTGWLVRWLVSLQEGTGTMGSGWDKDWHK